MANDEDCTDDDGAALDAAAEEDTSGREEVPTLLAGGAVDVAPAEEDPAEPLDDDDDEVLLGSPGATHAAVTTVRQHKSWRTGRPMDARCHRARALPLCAYNYPASDTCHGNVTDELLNGLEVQRVVRDIIVASSRNQHQAARGGSGSVICRLPFQRCNQHIPLPMQHQQRTTEARKLGQWIKVSQVC